MSQTNRVSSCHFTRKLVLLSLGSSLNVSQPLCPRSYMEKDNSSWAGIIKFSEIVSDQCLSLGTLPSPRSGQRGAEWTALGLGLPTGSSLLWVRQW